MTGKKEPGTTWHHTDVILRSDIFQRACEQEIDISDLCNRALADRMGIDYRQQHLEEAAIPEPVIIVRNNQSSVSPEHSPHLRSSILPPVINADDPSAATKVKQAKRQPVKKPAGEIPVPALPPQKERIVAAPVKGPVSGGRKQSKRKPNQEAVKQFFSSKISREDGDEVHVSKDEVYEMVIRWCHDHRVTPVPDRRSVTLILKNQFAVPEKMVEGIPCWTGIRLK